MSRITPKNKKYSAELKMQAVQSYMHFYNTRRYRKRLNCMTPCEYFFSTAA